MRPVIKNSEKIQYFEPLLVITFNLLICLRNRISHEITLLTLFYEGAAIPHIL